MDNIDRTTLKISISVFKILMKTLNIDTWDRKEQFLFFKDFEEPFWGVSIEADCTKSYNYCKKEGISFFLFYLHCSLVAANQTEHFAIELLTTK